MPLPPLSHFKTPKPNFLQPTTACQFAAPITCLSTQLLCISRTTSPVRRSAWGPAAAAPSCGGCCAPAGGGGRPGGRGSPSWPRGSGPPGTWGDEEEETRRRRSEKTKKPKRNSRGKKSNCLLPLTWTVECLTLFEEIVVC